MIAPQPCSTAKCHPARRLSPRIARIIAPQPFGVTLLGGAILILPGSMCVAFCALNVVEKIRRGPTTDWLGIAADVGLALIPSAFLAFGVFGTYLGYRTSFLPRRLQRLRRIASHPQAASRLPHRLIEYEFRRRRFAEPCKRELLRFLQPGQVVMRGGIRLPKRIEWCAGNSHFEPMETWTLHDREAGAEAALTLTGGKPLPTAVATQFEPLSARFRFASNIAVSIMLFAVVGLICRKLAVFDLRTDLPLAIQLSVSAARSVVWAALPLVILFGALHLWILTSARSRYLIPGGFLWVTQRAWRRETEIEVVTPRESPLFIEGQAMWIICSGKPRRIRLGRGRDVMVSNWFSGATPPTMEQLRSYFCGDCTPGDSRTTITCEPLSKRLGS